MIDSKVKWSLCFAFNYAQPITNCYKQREPGEVPLQSIQPPRKLWMIRAPQLWELVKRGIWNN